MIPLAIPNIGQAEAANLQRCVEENFVSTVGAFVTDFEAKVAKLSGTALGAATGSGTQGLHMALRALGVGHGDLVVVPSFTFIASANSISHSGATPWFVDISRHDWTLDPERLSEALRDKTTRTGDGVIHRATGKRVAAIMPVYTLGTPADMDAIGAVAREYGLPVVADAAAAIGVTYKGRPIGQLADLTVYSFNGNKTITSGGGGMIVGREDLVKRARHLTTTARVGRDYDHDEVGFNYRMTNIEAAVGCAQFDRLDEFLAAKKRIRDAYDTAFAGNNEISLFPAPSERGTAYWFSGLVFEGPEPRVVNTLCDRLKELGVEARPFWKPVHRQPPYRDAPAEDLSVTEDLWSRIITLPCSTSLTPEQQATVIAAVRQVLAA
ncbi:aminotransferase class I/II-fold pyridoxal phosphate-dependent enzyme [Arvimicrobium flavum]|uniref:aminotransferase class I/II-fold pyridoxal phosphate-dependent enzyme n=1 Tax=Arvimicrobium flavum TaxID=3393320 RepID=UPI00237BE180|nr:aminotransferase class I/II-fold pyridoxal phosphate-dependent enzyme [Mesorhizobium shangrilense]